MAKSRTNRRKHESPIARLAGRRKGTKGAHTTLLLGLIAAFGIAGVAVAGVLACREYCFDRNPRFLLRHLEIDAGETLTAGIVRECIGIREGMNCFEVNIEQVRAEFLSQAPNISDIEISRHLPDTIRVRIVERAPLARLGQGSTLTADAEGCVFVRRKGLGSLPVIVGVDAQACAPGARLSGLALAALQFLDACDAPAYGLRVNQVDVKGKDYIVVTLMDQREIKVAWRGMGRASSDARKHLTYCLTTITDGLRTPRAAAERYFDATVPHRMFGSS